MTYRYTLNGQPITGDFLVGEGDAAIQVPFGNLAHYSEPELSELGVTREEVEAQAAPRRFLWLAFMDLFTDEEQLAIVTATMASPAIKLWYDKAVGASYVDLDDARTVAGITALGTATLLTPERVTAILATPAP